MPFFLIKDEQKLNTKQFLKHRYLQDACDGIHKSATKRQCYDAIDRCARGHACIRVIFLVQESSEFYLWIRNHKDKIRLGLNTQVVEKLLHGVVSNTCVDRSSLGF